MLELDLFPIGERDPNLVMPTPALPAPIGEQYLSVAFETLGRDSCLERSSVNEGAVVTMENLHLGEQSVQFSDALPGFVQLRSCGIKSGVRVVEAKGMTVNLVAPMNDS